MLGSLSEFSIARLPRIVFGSPVLSGLARDVRGFGTRVLLVTGARSFDASPVSVPLLRSLEAEGITVHRSSVSGEPSPEFVDEVVAQFRGTPIDVVVGWGGGSALDAAKAIAGLLPSGNSVLDYLEGVGRGIPYRGPAVPLVAVPTTAGTGSEATKNAVLSRRGSDGFKRSFRDEELVPRLAWVDPELLATCPPEVMAANGMDALTQLLESFVSARANALTDAIAWSGMTAFFRGFEGAVGPDTGAPESESGASARAGRRDVAYAALLSGICLAQVGLGSVHGLASPLGAFFPIPHGVACGTLVAEASDINIRALQSRAPEHGALAKYARVGALCGGAGDGEALRHHLVTTLRELTARLALPRLGAFEMTEADVPRVVADSRGSSMKTNPVVLTDAEIAEVLRRRL